MIRRTWPSSGPSVEVVGHEAAGGHQDVEDGVAAGLDLQDRLLDHLGPAVALLGRQLGQPAEDVDLGQHGAGLDQPGGVGGDPVAEGGEQLVFEGVGAVLGVADLVLVLLQLGRDVALGVLDGLLADVVGRGSSSRCRSGRG